MASSVCRLWSRALCSAWSAVWSRSCSSGGLYSLIVSKIMSTMAAGIITVLPFASVALPLLLVFLGVGVLVGVFGGLTAIRNYLKV